MLPAPDVVKPGAADTVDHDYNDISYNPFDNSPGSGSFSSGLHSPTKRVLHRRKTSEHWQDTASIPWTPVHSRSRTSLETSRHPLRSDGPIPSTSSSPHHPGITRPRLTRLTLASEQASQDSPTDPQEVVTRDEEDRLVLIHEVRFP